MAKPKVCIHVAIEDDLETRIRDVCDVIELDIRASREELLVAMHDVEGILLTPRVRADVEFFDASPKLRVLSTTSVGYDPFDIDEATRRKVVVGHTPGVLTNAVTDLTMSMIFALALNLFTAESYVRQGGWARGEQGPPLGLDIRGKILGVIGYGRIGQQVTQRMQGLGMRTLWYDLFDSPHPDSPPSERRTLNDLLAESDFVSLHTNLDEKSRHLIGDEELIQMKSSAYLVNTARGGLIDQSALTKALRSGTIAGAALDVLKDEPPEENEAITSLPNVICFPHIGSATNETRRAMRELAVDNLLTALRGERPPAAVNPDVIN
jgi:glyoxylate reductase